MLYRFQSKEAPDVLMLSDLTERLFNIIEKPLEKQGVFLLEQLPDAISKLEAAIAIDAQVRQKSIESLSEDEQAALKKNDRLGQRAHPFLELLKKALATQKIVIWGV